jgi:hypothetical protein
MKLAIVIIALICFVGVSCYLYGERQANDGWKRKMAQDFTKIETEHNLIKKKVGIK